MESKLAEMNSVIENVAGQELSFTLQFERDPESEWYTVHVVELPGCVSQGATIEEAKANAASALESYIEVLLESAVRSQVSGLASGTNGEAAETCRVRVRPKFEVRA